MDTLDKGMIHIVGGTELDGSRFHHTAQNGTRFKTYEWFISGILHIVFSDHGWPWVTIIAESKAADKGILYINTDYPQRLTKGSTFH